MSNRAAPIEVSTGFNKAFSKSRSRPVKPNERADGELYDRPRPNPFTPEWGRGYDDGSEGRPGNLGRLEVGQRPENYWDGFHTGCADREDLDRMGSSNA